MKESLMYAKEELKRIDHLIYVTLKYTRTVDVLLSVLDRMINSYGFIIETLLKYAKNEGLITEMPDTPIVQADLVKKTFDSKNIKEHMKKYLLFRKLVRCEYEKTDEFRRHVTMKAVINGEKVEVNIDSVTEDFHQLKKFIEYLQRKIS